MSVSDHKECPAGLLLRGLAYLLDCGFVFLLFVITQLLVFTPMRTVAGITDDWFRSGLNTELYTLVTISIPVWLYFAMLECSPWQATLGKRLFGLQAVSAQSHTRIPPARSLLRTVVKLLPWELAHLGNNLPVPVWYADDPGFRVAFAFSGLLMTANIVVLCFNRRRQGVHDLIARTLVLKFQKGGGQE